MQGDSSSLRVAMMRGRGGEMSTEAQKRAVAKYRREKMRQINIKFSPNERDLHEWVKKQGGTASGYVKDLIRKDMQERS